MSRVKQLRQAVTVDPKAMSIPKDYTVTLCCFLNTCKGTKASRRLSLGDDLEIIKFEIALLKI